ncbi:hypothetical protein D6D01_09737, partial [Aureobasidium pullulans]
SRRRTRVTHPTQHSLAYIPAQSTQQGPQFPREHQQINRTSTDPARTIYATATDKLHKARLARIQQKLSSIQEAVRVENAAHLRRRCLTAQPTSQPLLLADMDVAAAFCIRLLTTPEEEQDICRHCNRAYTFGHEDTRRARTRQTTAKHDKIYQALGTALRAILDNRVFLKPRGDYSPYRHPDRQPEGNTIPRRSSDLPYKGIGKEGPVRHACTRRRGKKEQTPGTRPSIQPVYPYPRRPTRTYKELQRSFAASTSEWLDEYISVLLIRLRARNWMGYGID